jgi:uncharacterized coiled-coil DUF342 family protein
MKNGLDIIEQYRNQKWEGIKNIKSMEEYIDEALAERDLLIYHVKQANKERGELNELLIDKLQEAEKQITFLEEQLEDACRVIPERN